MAAASAAGSARIAPEAVENDAATMPESRMPHTMSCMVLPNARHVISVTGSVWVGDSLRAATIFHGWYFGPQAIGSPAYSSE